MGAAMISPLRRIGATCAALGAALLLASAAYGQATDNDAAPPVERTGEAVFADACASCHGTDGRGRTAEEAGFSAKLANFTDCSFATREPDANWIAIIHRGGPARALSWRMPAFDRALSKEDILAAVGYLRSFCKDDRWPRGDLNLPRALFTEKAYPVDEAVAQTSIAVEGPAAGETEFRYDRRFGANGQLEVGVPAAWSDNDGKLATGLGDITLAWKQAIFASMDTRAILSVGGGVILPTGSKSRGLGDGATTLEPFVLFGEALPNNAFFQSQVVADFPLRDGYENTVGLRAVMGRTFRQDEGYGRAWTPMLELVSDRNFSVHDKTNWSIVPQMQVTLSRRQHVALGLGANIPVTSTDVRDTQAEIYLLWDWREGGLREGW
jgi:mono/diheme cytochrome c family protein